MIEPLQDLPDDSLALMSREQLEECAANLLSRAERAEEALATLQEFATKHIDPGWFSEAESVLWKTITGGKET